jgi:aminoglycoside phosphotransferase (APT) family kinase protein
MLQVSTRSGSFAHSVDDIEPRIRRVFERRAARQLSAPYRSRSNGEVADALNRFLEIVSPGTRASRLARMGGGASKEQFVFEIDGANSAELDGRYVLRMEPNQSISESDRLREFEILKAVQGLVPAPEPIWVDAEGETLGQPGAIMKFVGGTTKPKNNGRTVTGLGTTFPAELRETISDQFMRYLVAIHGFDWRNADLPSFSEPAEDPRQAALWQVNWWARVWREDALEKLPIMALAERWMRENLPAISEPVLVHGDYRTGNYLFDEDSRQITAILDWELCHLGDFHQDLAWTLQPPFGVSENGVHLASGLFTREAFIEKYERQSGRTVDRRSLHFYEVLGAFECIAISLGSGLRSAKEQQNHQEVLLTWLAAVGHIFETEMCDLLEGGPR